MTTTMIAEPAARLRKRPTNWREITETVLARPRPPAHNISVVVCERCAAPFKPPIRGGSAMCHGCQLELGRARGLPVDCACYSICLALGPCDAGGTGRPCCAPPRR